MKPVVQIKNAEIVKTNSWGVALEYEILTGIPVDYPDDHQYYSGCLQNGKQIWTTKIVAHNGNTVETVRTIYKILNWNKNV